MDGGTVWNVNVSSAINQCHDMGATNEEITLDVVVCYKMAQPSSEVGTTMTNWQTAKSIRDYYLDSDNFAAAMRAA